MISIPARLDYVRLAVYNPQLGDTFVTQDGEILLIGEDVEGDPIIIVLAHGKSPYLSDIASLDDVLVKRVNIRLYHEDAHGKETE